MRLSDFIISDIHSILAEWDEFARTLKPASSGMTFFELRNHAELMLRGIAKDIATAQTADEQVLKSHGGETRTAQTVTGEEHGLARLESRFTTEQLASEFRALRASVLKLWGRKVVLSSSNIDEVIRFNEAIDQLLAASISSFAQATKERFDEEQKRKEQFLAMLAHELRNPLAPISASATILKVASEGSEVVYKASEVIGRQVSHITALVEDLLDVSRVQNGSAALKVKTLDFRQIVDSALEQVNPEIAARGHHLATPYLEQPIFMLGDAKRLIQVVVNLLGNSAKYTPNSGQISLQVKVHGNCVEVIVEDDGEGIAPEFLPHVFELFSQATPSIDRSNGGLGLGLPLVKSLVEQHSGTVTCFSAGIGKGSTFSVTLPIYPHELEYEETQVSSTTPLPAQQPVKIMVVDDNVDAAESLGMLLETLGHEVIIANGSAEALSKARTELPAAFLLDIGLPLMDGNELARRIRALPGLSDSLLVAVTGYSQAQNRKEAIEAGFNHFMTKPIEIAAVQSILNSFITSR